MNTKNENDKKIDPLNVTIIGEIIPLAFSTELKQKKPFQKKIDYDYSFETGNNDTIFNNENKMDFNQPANQITTHKHSTFQVIEESENEISPRYLVKHKKPDFNSIIFLNEHNEIEEKIPLRDSNINQPNSQDMSYFRRLSNSIKDSHSSILMEQVCNQLSTEKKSTLTLDKEYITEMDDTIYIMERAEAIDLNNTTVSGLDELLEDVDLSKSLNVTKLAKDLKKSEYKKEERRKEELLLTKKDKNACDVVLLSNKSHMLWIAVSVNTKEHNGKFDYVYNWLYHNNLIKSFVLNLRSSLSQKVHISLKGNSDSFFLTNQQGNNESRFIDVAFEPQTDRKFYVIFHPTNSNYHQDTIIISVGERRFKISLFGYAEPSIVDLKGFYEIVNPNNSEKKLIVKNFTKFKGVNTFTVSIFNSGARTAFVSFKRCNNASHVTFQPKMFLLIPKTKMEFNVIIKGDESSVNFVMFSVDEELRRSARISFRDLPNNTAYTFFNSIGIFTNLPEEKSIRQDDLPKYDWRPHLCRQIKEFHRECCLNFNYNTYDSSSIDQIPSESITSIGKMSRSSLTSRSALTNLEYLNYMNSTESFSNSLHQTLSSVIIFKDVNVFSQTCVKMSNYLGIFIHNNNQFMVQWGLSEITSMTRDSLFEKNIIEKSNSSSVYSLNSIPIYDPASCISISCKEGSLESDETIIIPVRFTPENTGKTQCRCTVKIFSSNDDNVRLERDLEFVAEAVRKDKCQFIHPKIPYFEIDKAFEVCLQLSEYKDKKYQIKLVTKNKSNHNLQIFASRLKEPFYLKNTTIYISEKINLFCINFKVLGKGIFNEVLVLSDNEGSSTFVTLKVDVK